MHTQCLIKYATRYPYVAGHIRLIAMKSAKFMRQTFINETFDVKIGKPTNKRRDEQCFQRETFPMIYLSVS